MGAYRIARASRRQWVEVIYEWTVIERKFGDSCTVSCRLGLCSILHRVTIPPSCLLPVPYTYLMMQKIPGHDDLRPSNSKVVMYKLCAGRPSVAPNLSGTNPVHLDFSPYQASIRRPSDNHPTGATARHPRNARPGPAPANVNVTNPIIVSTSSRIAALERR